MCLLFVVFSSNVSLKIQNYLQHNFSRVYTSVGCVYRFYIPVRKREQHFFNLRGHRVHGDFGFVSCSLYRKRDRSQKHGRVVQVRSCTRRRRVCASYRQIVRLSITSYVVQHESLPPEREYLGTYNVINHDDDATGEHITYYNIMYIRNRSTT